MGEEMTTGIVGQRLLAKLRTQFPGLLPKGVILVTLGNPGNRGGRSRKGLPNRPSSQWRWEARGVLDGKPLGVGSPLGMTELLKARQLELTKDEHGTTVTMKEK